MKCIKKSLFYSVFTLILISVLAFSVLFFSVPRSVSAYSVNDAIHALSSSFISVDIPENAYDADIEYCPSVSAEAKLFGVVPVGKININVFKDIELVPGGIPFGMNIKTDGVIISALSDVDGERGNVNPGVIAGLKTGDIITEADGKAIYDAKTLSYIAINSDGMPIELNVQRSGEKRKILINPVFSQSEKEWKLGLWVKDSAAGIGTVTFIEPESGSFAGLGHGVVDIDTGELVPMKSGTVFDCEISGIKKSVDGSPGELRGTLVSENGFLFGNLNQGVYGQFNKTPATSKSALPIALKQDIKKGKATILCTVFGNEPKEYEIEITDLFTDGNGFRDMIVKVTDEELLSETGGIVQGMSGSPIIQNGKIVGAITHVLIDNPKTGYGIFIENMLSEMPEIYS